MKPGLADLRNGTPMEVILDKIADAFEKFGAHTAISMFDSARAVSIQCRYSDLKALTRLAIERIGDRRCEPIGIFCQKTPESYAAVLATLFTGNYFVPLNPKLPSGRLREICAIAKIQTVLTDIQHRDLAARALEDVVNAIHALTGSDLNSRTGATIEIAPADPDDLAYVMFTSGSTGRPKGVMISRRNLAAVLAEVETFVAPSQSDRFSQIYDLSFDLSLGEIFAALSSGATLCPFNTLEISSFAHYLEREQISIFACTPAFLQNALQGERLKNTLFPSIRASFFCGEKLPLRLAEHWTAHAPRTSIENLYGPTETTLYVTRHTWEPARDRLPVIPIGRPFGENRVHLVDDKLGAVSLGESGEIIVAGPQVSPGYLGIADSPAFFETGNVRWYRTGDQGRIGETGAIEILGRLDSQAKVLGQRIELEEVESLLTRFAGSAAGWVAFAYPLDSYGSPTGTVAVTNTRMTEARAKDLCRSLMQHLPHRIVPAKIFFLETFPLTASGKLDRPAVFAALAKRELEPLFPAI